MAAVDLAKIAEYTDISHDARELLEHPEKQTKLSLSFRTEDGGLTRADTFVVYYNTARGPAKGGIRMWPDVTMKETTELAELMAWKTALMGVPFGGGKAGIRLDPKRFNRQQKAELIREFVHITRSELESGAYIPAPDMGTSEFEMAVIFGEMHILECVTGKPPRVGGLPGRREATGRSLSTCLMSAAEDLLGIQPSRLTAAVQGFGNVGGWTAKFLCEAGCKVVAISDLTGAVWRKNGLPVDDLLAWVAQGKRLNDFPDADRISREELLEQAVDVLVPAAVGHVFTADVARRVKARMIVEGANGPTTPEGDAVFERKGIPVIPDILANSGGVIASYIEWRQAKSGSLTPKGETFDTLDSLIRDGLQRVVEGSKRMKCTYRTAALVIAVEEVVKSMRDRGWF